MKKVFALVAAVALLALQSAATIITTSPEILQESTQGVVLTYHADSPMGNNGMLNLPASTGVYAHIGAITNLSTGGSDWKYAPTWGDNAAKYKLEYAGPNTWTLNIGNLRTFFGITDSNEHVEKIAMVLRTADKTQEGKTAAGGDIFVEVVPQGFQMIFSTDAPSTVLRGDATLNFTAVTTDDADITIAVNGTTIATATGQSKLVASYNFNATGNYTVTATATRNGQTATRTIAVAYPAPSKPGTYPGGVPKMGAVRNADGTVTFCLAAPGKSSVVLVPSWDDYQVLDKNSMLYQDYNGYRYFFTTVSGLNDWEYYPYYYIVDGTTKVADPYARLVLDCYSDKWLENSIWPDMPKYPYEKFDDVMLAVYKGNLDNGYQFADFTIPDQRRLVIYEMLIRDFTGTEGQANGEGTLASAMEKIPYLASLGINAIELMPVMEFNGNNSWGYNTNFYMAPDKAYGSPYDLKKFVDLCHINGIAVILDIVLNHSDGLHPWYKMYNIADNPFYNAEAPHAYGVLNDWKQENPLVQQQWADALQFWLKSYNVDGFRFDLVKGLGTSYGSNTDAYNASRVDVMKKLHAAMKAVKPNAIHINENLAGAQEENEMAVDGQLNWANINYNSCQYAMGEASGSDLQRFLSTNDGGRRAFSTVAYAESHDEERMGYKQIAYGAQQVKASEAVRMQRLGQVAVQMLMCPGPKMIWQFGELGADQTTKSGSDNNTDPKIVNWNYLNNSDRAALHGVYKALCNLRKDNPDLFGPTATLTLSGFANSISTMRTMRLTAGDKEVVAFINPLLQGNGRNIPATTTKLNANNSQLIVASSNYATPKITGTSTTVNAVGVPANGFAVFATANTTGVNDIVADNSNTVAVHATPGTIIVDGEYTSATVFNLAGMQQASLNVPSGVYIVNVDGTAHKVVVP